MASKSPRGAKSSPPRSARNPNRVKTRTGSTTTQPIEDLGPSLRGGPSRPRRERRGSDPDAVEPVSDSHDDGGRQIDPR
jgi:hypothetical protein